MPWESLLAMCEGTGSGWGVAGSSRARRQEAGSECQGPGGIRGVGTAVSWSPVTLQLLSQPRLLHLSSQQLRLCAGVATSHLCLPLRRPTRVWVLLNQNSAQGSRGLVPGPAGGTGPPVNPKRQLMSRREGERVPCCPHPRASPSAATRVC